MAVRIVAAFESYDSPQYSVGEAVHALTPAGAYETGFPLSPPPLSPNTELYPRDVAITDTHIFVGGLYGLYKYDHAGTLVGSILSGGDPFALLCYRAGKLVAANTGSAGRLDEIDPSDMSDVWTVALTSSEDVTDIDLDSNGDIFTAAHTFADPYYIRKRSGTDGSEIVSGGWPYLWGSTSGYPPTNIAVGPNDEVAVCGKTPDGLNTIRLLESDGTLRWSTEFDLEGFSISSGVVVDTNGDVLVSDYANIRKFAAADGSTVWTLEHLDRTASEIEGIENGAPGQDGASYWLAQRTSGSDVGWELAKVSSAGAVEWETIIIPLQNPAPSNMYSYNIASPSPYGAAVDPLAPTSDGTDQRVYAQVSRTAGSLLDALDAPAVEDGIRMGFFPDEGLTLGELVPFYEAFAPSEVRHRFYAFPVPSQNHLNEYVGGTKLGRMRKAFPSRFVAAAADLPLGTATGTLTPQNLLAELFNAWEGEFDWFSYESPLPDLRYRTPSQDYTSASAGLVEFDAIVLEQDEEAGERLSMRAILDRFLALFPGTAIIQKANGDVALRPTYGPDAPASSTRTLTNDDLVSISEGEADPRGVYNRARVNTRGGSIQDGVAVLTDVTTVFGWDQRVDDWETYLADESLIDSSYELVPRSQFRPWDASLVRGDDVTLDIAISLYALVWDGTPFDAGSTITSHTLEASDSWTSVSVPFGSSVTRRVEDKYEEGLFGAGGWDIWAEVRIEANAQRGLAISAVSTNLGETDGSPWSTFAAIVEIANVTGDGYDLNTARVTGEFGYDGETLLDGSGSDILVPSVGTWGERELTVNAEAFQLSPEQAAELAQGLVLHHINPRIIRTCEQSWSGGYPVLQDDVGLQVTLPNSEVGILQRRDYADDYRSVFNPQVSSIIEVAITEAAPYDTSSVLLDVSGGFLRDLAGEQITEV